MSASGNQSRIFALTGGMGSGKSSVAKIWSGAGVPVVSADELARLAVEAGTPTLRAVVDEFGDGFLLPDGSLDRKKLGERVFPDSAARARLNSLVHPEVRRLAELRFAEARASGVELICYDIPLLFETGQQDKFRPVVVVTATPLQQMERVAARDSLAPSQVAARLHSQIPLREKEDRADIVIVNSGTLDELAERARMALEEVRAWKDEP